MVEQAIQIPTSDQNFLHATLFLCEDRLSLPPLVLMAHGFSGDRQEWGRFPIAARQMNQHGFDVITFDFTGSGENPRVPITLSQQVKDLQDVMKWAKLQEYSRFHAIGLSFGGLTLLYAELEESLSHIFWAPAFYKHRDIKRIELFLFKLATLFHMTPIKRKSESTGYVLIDQQFVVEFLNTKETIDTKLEHIRVPTLILHGDSDKSVNPAYSAEAFTHLQPMTESFRMEVPGAGHNFTGNHLDFFIKKSIEWMKKYS